MTINTALAPYFDDFDEFKNFHQILFNPSLAVQARELSQLQSILKNQIKKFGNHIFQHGSVVIPGNVFAEENTPYVKIEPSYSGTALTTNNFLDKIVVGATSGVRAKIKTIAPSTSTDPITFYLSYLSGGQTSGVANGKLVFDPAEELYVEGATGIRAITKADGAYVGYGVVAYVNSGVYYINGSFVSNTAQSVVVSKYTNQANASVAFKIVESIVTPNDDESLLDPANGSSNYGAPGADRLKIDLVLSTLTLDQTITDDYVELMRWKNGVLQEYARYPKYSELDKSLARNIFDQSGNFIVSGFGLEVKEHLRIGNNSGLYDDGDIAKMVYNVAPGKAYVNGFSVEKLASSLVEVYKARTNDHIKIDVTTTETKYGQYLLVSDLKGTLAIDTREQVQLWNTSATTGGTQVGTANAIAVDYYTGDGSAYPITKVYLSNINIGNYTFDDIGGIRSTNMSAKVVAEYGLLQTTGTFVAGDTISVGTLREATVAFFNPVEGKLYAHKSNSAKYAPKIGDTIIDGSNNASIASRNILVSNGQSSLVFPFPYSSIKTVKNGLNAYDLEYTTYRKLQILTGQTQSATVTGTIVPIDAGTFIAIDSTGILPRSQFTLNTAGNKVTKSSSATTDITIYCQVVREAGTPRTKSPNTASGVVKTSAQTINLNHADVYELVSVVNSSGVDIKNYYTLNRNVTDYSYEISQINLKPGVALPSGSVTITYKYFLHSAGDFFTADSYTALGASYLDLIPTYISPSTGETYSLRDCMDFRTISSAPNNLVVSESFVTTSIQRFVGRIDSICLDQQGNISVISGIPDDKPKLPSVPTGLFELHRVLVPAYTPKITQIQKAQVAVTRYRQVDINRLEKRLKNLEDYTTLTTSESTALQTNIVDAASGLDRYKTGYLVENVSDPFQIAAWDSPNFSATFDSVGITCGMNLAEVEFYPLVESIPSMGYKINNGILTLPYTETVFAKVAQATRITNLNPFMLVHWNGTMTLVPPSLEWVEVFDNPEIVVNITQTIFEDQVVPTPAPSPAASPTSGSGSSQFVIGPSGGSSSTPISSKPTVWWINEPIGSVSGFGGGGLIGEGVSSISVSGAINGDSTSSTPTIVDVSSPVLMSGGLVGDATSGSIGSFDPNSNYQGNVGSIFW